MENKDSLDHAWNYFQIHAQQRMITFNFYVILIGILITCIATAAHDIHKNSIIISIIGISICASSFIFYKLDQRISFLIKCAESIMIKHEPDDAAIFKTEIDQTIIAAKNGQWTYGKAFRIVFRTMSILGAAVFSTSIYIIVT